MRFHALFWVLTCWLVSWVDSILYWNQVLIYCKFKTMLCILCTWDPLMLCWMVDFHSTTAASWPFPILSKNDKVRVCDKHSSNRRRRLKSWKNVNCELNMQHCGNYHTLHLTCLEAFPLYSNTDSMRCNRFIDWFLWRSRIAAHVPMIWFCLTR